MVVFLSTTCPRPLQSTTWDSLHWHSALCTSSIPVCPGICCLHRVHCQVPTLLNLFVFLLCHLNLVEQNSMWMMVATQQPDFGGALCVHSMFPVNIVVAYLSEDKALPKAFSTDSRAGVLNCEFVVPINWDRACDDVEDGFPVDCSGMGYVNKKSKPPHKRKREFTRRRAPRPRIT